MYTYIIIDDESLIRKGIIQKLEPLRDQVICCGEAANGKKGIELIENSSPDFVILDMYMPVMGGMELLPYLSEHYPELPMIVISRYQNFDYMKQAITSKAIDYLLKPFSEEELQEAVRNVIDILKSQKQLEIRFTAIQEEREDAFYNLDIRFLENLILGYETEAHEFVSRKLSFLNQAHAFVLFTLYQKNPPRNTDLQDWLSESNYGNLGLCVSHPSIQQFQFVILFVPDTLSLRERYINRFLDLLTLWTSQQGLNTYIGISDGHAELSQLHTAFSETTQALDSRKIAGSQSFWFFSKEPPAPLLINWAQTDEFLFRIESGTSIEVQLLFENLFDYFYTLPDCTLADIKHHCEQLSSQCHLILNYYLNKQTNHSSSSSSMQAIVNTLFSVDEVKKYYRQFFLNVTNMVRDKSVYANQALIDRIMIYMQRNYQKDLTQEFIASLFYLNRSYLSQLFRQKTGEKFIDYLNDIRIEKAKELLTTTDRKMYQIAKASGYDNTKYFFRVFKKRTGCTPEQYREKMAK